LTESLSWVVRVGHPLAAAGAVDLEALTSVPHAVISGASPDAGDDRTDRRNVVTQASWEDAGALDAALDSHGITRRVGVRVPDTYSALAIASRSDMAALIPTRLALISAQSGRIALIEPPYPSPAVEVTLLYLKERLNEPAIAWMRALICGVAESL
jgi:DNA-binding transcriptional LysR family regulator